MNDRKLLVIAGASGAIGSAVAFEAAKSCNFDVIGFGRSRGLAQERNLGQTPTKYEQLDILGPNALERLDEIMRADNWVEIDWIHAIGGFAGYKTFAQHTEKDIRETLDLNLTSAVLGLHAWLKRAIVLRRGRFVAYSSIAAPGCYPFLAAFNASKVAIETLVRSISNEVLIDEVQVSCISLPTVRTPVEVELKPEADVESWITPAEVATITLEHIASKTCPGSRGATIPHYRPSATFFGDSVVARYGKTKGDLIS